MIEDGVGFLVDPEGMVVVDWKSLNEAQWCETKRVLYYVSEVLMITKS